MQSCQYSWWLCKRNDGSFLPGQWLQSSGTGGSAATEYAIHAAFPDWRVQIEDMIGEDNRVAIRWHGCVTHQGVFQGIPPTGRQISVSGINIYRIEEGKIATEWEQTDTLGMLRQLGLLHQMGL